VAQQVGRLHPGRVARLEHQAGERRAGLRLVQNLAQARGFDGEGPEPVQDRPELQAEKEDGQDRGHSAARQGRIWQAGDHHHGGERDQALGDQVTAGELRQHESEDQDQPGQGAEAGPDERRLHLHDGRHAAGLPAQDEDQHGRRQQQGEEILGAVAVDAEKEAGKPRRPLSRRGEDGGLAVEEALEPAHDLGGVDVGPGEDAGTESGAGQQRREVEREGPRRRPAHQDQPAGRAGEEEEHLEVRGVEQRRHAGEQEPGAGAGRLPGDPVRQREPAQEERTGHEAVHETPEEDVVVGHRQGEERVPLGPAGAAAEGGGGREDGGQGERDDDLSRRLDGQEPGEAGGDELEQPLGVPEGQLVGLAEPADGIVDPAHHGGHGELLGVVQHRWERRGPERQHPEKRGKAERAVQQARRRRGGFRGHR
jgi:hypothetical protein